MRILLGMSGGLDSTYAAHKLISEGHIVEGAVIKMHRFTEVSEAALSARALGIPLHVIDASDLFEKKVIANFINEYKSARTPNPCVICNSDVKFKSLFEYAQEHGFDKIATGHYASIKEINTDGEKRYALELSADKRKDQTYMLWRLPQYILSRLIFPLSKCEKSGVREDAKKTGLLAADRAESQEICFIPDGKYAEFIEARAGKCPEGDFVDNNGNILGRHKGIIHYTVGQRKGLGISLGERAFITKINAPDNTITLDINDSFSKSFKVRDLVFSGLSNVKAGERIKLYVKHRYLAPLAEASVVFDDDNGAEAFFSEPVRAVTPGQSAVFYQNGMVMAGGFID